MVLAYFAKMTVLHHLALSRTSVHRSVNFAAAPATAHRLLHVMAVGELPAIYLDGRAIRVPSLPSRASPNSMMRRLGQARGRSCSTFAKIAAPVASGQACARIRAMAAVER